MDQKILIDLSNLMITTNEVILISELPRTYLSVGLFNIKTTSF